MADGPPLAGWKAVGGWAADGMEICVVEVGEH